MFKVKDEDTSSALLQTLNRFHTLLWFQWESEQLNTGRVIDLILFSAFREKVP